ncbi:MAG: hypothetical protein AAFQ87_12445 [Bacteroidota bacterium]
MRLSLLLPLILLGLLSCKTADLRTPEVIAQNDEAKAKAILQKMSEAHALSEWSKIKTYQFRLRDEFFGLMGGMGNPFPNNTALGIYEAIPGTFTSRMSFQDDKWAGKIWGIQSWKTYAGDANNPVQWHEENNPEIEFWLPTYQYFIELPQRILEADVLRYAGERRQGETNYDLFFASWKSAEPQKNYDQYLLWIDQQSHLIKQIQYTVRDQADWIQASLQYQAYSRENGRVPFPAEMVINLGAPNPDKAMHKIRVGEIRLDAVSQAELLPDPELGTAGKP